MPEEEKSIEPEEDLDSYKMPAPDPWHKGK